MAIGGEISQRELRNDSGRIMRTLSDGETFMITRNGEPVGVLTPLRRHRFVRAEAAIELFRNAAPVNCDRLRHDLDRVADQAIAPVPSANRPERGLLDTSVVIDLEHIPANSLPLEVAISAVNNVGRKPRGARAVDLLIAATAVAESLPRYTRNPDDFRALHDLVVPPA